MAWKDWRGKAGQSSTPHGQADPNKDLPKPPTDKSLPSTPPPEERVRSTWSDSTQSDQISAAPVRLLRQLGQAIPSTASLQRRPPPLDVPLPPAIPSSGEPAEETRNVRKKPSIKSLTSAVVQRLSPKSPKSQDGLIELTKKEQEKQVQRKAKEKEDMEKERQKALKMAEQDRLQKLKADSEARAKAAKEKAKREKDEKNKKGQGSGRRH